MSKALLLACAIALFAFFTDVVKTQPPGGVYSNCCPYSVEVCNYLYPVDSKFRPKSCSAYQNTTRIPCDVRAYFMQQAFQFLFSVHGSPCPFNAFGAIMVNHTAGPTIEDATIVCYGYNKAKSITPFWHAEIDLLTNCSNYIIENFGVARLEDPTLWQQLSLYDTAEPCSMCMSAIRWTKVGETIWSVSDPQLDNTGWYQIEIRASEVQHTSNQCVFGKAPLNNTSYQTRLVQEFEDEEYLPYFAWQFDATAPCPSGCIRSGGTCVSGKALPFSGLPH